jgi:hypothetical protein
MTMPGNSERCRAYVKADMTPYIRRVHAEKSLRQNRNKQDRPVEGDAAIANEFIDQLNQNPLAAVTIGNLRIGFVDEVNGPSSATVNVPLSRYEALLLVRYWVGEYESCEYWMKIQYSSSDSRILAHAGRRVGELRDAGLVTQQQIDDIYDEICAERASAGKVAKRPNTST